MMKPPKGSHKLRSGRVSIEKHVAGAHLSGLRAFRADYPEVPLHVISHVENPYRIDDVQVMPWKTYLGRLVEYL
jgi:hypothetical protein